tara:strand:- start:55 stop:843 length:789 start_codon:yes stop_codon:yes gene_type:complete
MNYKLISLFIIGSFSNFVMAQLNEKLELNEGVKSYEQGDYKTAEQHFLNSFNENPEYSTAIYNAGNAAYLNGNFESAREYYDQYINTIVNKNEKAEALHNIGNTYLKNFKEKKDGKSLAESINFYKESLRNNPSDEDTRYNLAYALNQLQQQQQQEKNNDQQQNNDNKDQQKNDQEKKDDQQKDKQDEKGDQKKNEQEKKDDQQNNKPQNNSKQEEEKKGEMSQKQIEKNLDAINNDEQKILRKVNLKKGDSKKKTKQTKDW